MKPFFGGETKGILCEIWRPFSRRNGGFIGDLWAGLHAEKACGENAGKLAEAVGG